MSPNVTITGVAIGKTDSNTYATNTALDVSGSINVTSDASFNANINVNKISFLSNVAEKIVTTTIGTDASCNLDYSQGSIFYLGSTAPSSNMRFNITNLPNTKDLSRSYLVTTIYKGNGTYHGNTVTVSTTSSTLNAPTYTPVFPSAPSSVIVTGKLVTQTVGYLYFADASYVVSNTTCYSN